MPTLTLADASGALTAALLGVVQGFTEFLPVSSSGHVALGAFFFGLEEPPLSLAIALHGGTLLATVVFLRADLRSLGASLRGGASAPRTFLSSQDGQTLLAIVIASIPTAVIGLLLRHWAEALSLLPWAIGACLLVSGLLVLSTRGREGARAVLPLGAAALLGLAQGLAVLPGISRSGTTIAVAMLLGLRGEAAFRFSFLLSLPAVTGAVLLELLGSDAMERLGAGALIGGAIAALSGYLALALLRRLVTEGRLALFAIYLFPIGLALIIWDF
ncbi:MAG: undecaprenyl-diphosphate phosphatase [Myxococcales bacterium]|nr:undecaprenyl-diphosphate phosphatase [Myxococcales bacterium]